MLLDELKVDLTGWTYREKVLLQLLINQMRVPLRWEGIKGPDSYGELYREHSTIRRLIKPIVKRLNERPGPRGGKSSVAPPSGGHDAKRVEDPHV